MMNKNPALGRGLADLLGHATAGPAPPADKGPVPAPAPPAEQLARLPLDLLQRGRYQPRIDMRPETLQELADSIKAQGVVQPIVVRPLEAPAIGETQRYEIIAGERRWRAAQMARSEEHTSELQSPCNLVCRLLLEKKKRIPYSYNTVC